MNEWAILIRLPVKRYLGEEADAEHSRRLYAIMGLLFTLGPAWHAIEGGVLLRSELSHAELVSRVAPLVEPEDFVVVIEMSAKTITAIGYDWEPDDLDALYPNVARLAGLDPPP